MKQTSLFTFIGFCIVIISSCTQLKNPCPNPYLSFEDKKFESRKFSGKKFKKFEKQTYQIAVKQSIIKNQITAQINTDEKINLLENEATNELLLASIKSRLIQTSKKSIDFTRFHDLHQTEQLIILPIKQIKQTKPEKKDEPKKSNRLGSTGVIMILLAIYTPFLSFIPNGIRLVVLCIGLILLMRAIIENNKERNALPQPPKISKEELKEKRKANNTLFKFTFWILLTIICIIILSVAFTRWTDSLWL